jgi:molecular chaperone HscB
LKKQHNIDANELTTKFRHLQSLIHPDKFSGKSEEEQKLSSEWSSLINKAYKVLQNSLARGEYLLKLNDVLLPEDNTMTDPEFLLEMMEKNEEAS